MQHIRDKPVKENLLRSKIFLLIMFVSFFQLSLGTLLASDNQAFDKEKGASKDKIIYRIPDVLIYSHTKLESEQPENKVFKYDAF